MILKTIKRDYKQNFKLWAKYPNYFSEIELSTFFASPDTAAVKRTFSRRGNLLKIKTGLIPKLLRNFHISVWIDLKMSWAEVNLKKSICHWATKAMRHFILCGKRWERFCKWVISIYAVIKFRPFQTSAAWKLIAKSKKQVSATLPKLQWMNGRVLH